MSCTNAIVVRRAVERAGGDPVDEIRCAVGRDSDRRQAIVEGALDARARGPRALQSLGGDNPEIRRNRVLAEVGEVRAGVRLGLEERDDCCLVRGKLCFGEEGLLLPNDLGTCSVDASGNRRGRSERANSPCHHPLTQASRRRSKRIHLGCKRTQLGRIASGRDNVVVLRGSDRSESRDVAVRGRSARKSAVRGVGAKRGAKARGLDNLHADLIATRARVASRNRQDWRCVRCRDRPVRLRVDCSGHRVARRVEGVPARHSNVNELVADPDPNVAISSGRSRKGDCAGRSRTAGGSDSDGANRDVLVHFREATEHPVELATRPEEIDCVLLRLEGDERVRAVDVGVDGGRA